MKVFVTGVNGQLGHDIMNELDTRGHTGIGSDLKPEYSGNADGTAVIRMPYMPMDITDVRAIRNVLDEVRPDAVLCCLDGGRP